MDLPPNFIQNIDYNGPTWKSLKLWLESVQQTKIGMLISEPTHDKSNQIRGALAMLQQILALEKAATQAAQNGNYPNDTTRAYR